MLIVALHDLVAPKSTVFPRPGVPHKLIAWMLAGYDFEAHEELWEKLLRALTLHSFPPELSFRYTESLSEMPEVLAQHSKLRYPLT